MPNDVEVQAAMTAITMLTREHRARYGGGSLPSLEAEALAVLEAAEAVRAVSPPEEPAEGRVWMDGQWWQVEQFNDRGDLLFVDRGSHRPEYRSAKWANDRYEPVYRLVPLSQEPPDAE